MKSKVLCIISAVVLTTACITVSCKDNKEKVISVLDVTLDKDRITIVCFGESEQLLATVTPTDANNRSITWESGDEAVATVDDNGLVTATGRGNCEITVTTVDGGKTAKCVVTIPDPDPDMICVPVTGISLDETELTLNLNDKWQLNPTVIPSDATQKNVTWKTSNADVVSVTYNGLITARGYGESDITVSTFNSTHSATCHVTVPRLVTSVKLDNNTLTLPVGTTRILYATVLPTAANNKEVIWSSDKPSVGDVDENGKVTAKATGTAIITVTTVDGGFTSTCEVTVVEIDDSPFVKTFGTNFTKDGQVIVFKGGGQWFGAGWTDAVYAKLADIGFNSVRLYLDARDATIANPTNLRSTTLTNIDDNIALAKKYGMTIILNIHVSPGASGISDRGFFTNTDRQQRLAAVWKALAERYVNEPTIAGYDIINEPTVALNPSATQNYDCNGTPYQSYFLNYRNIIQDIVDAVRSVDMNHTIIVERLWIDPGASCSNCWWFGINDQRDCWQNYDGKYNFPDINDPANNYAYTYHCYEPNTYCHQSPRNAVYPSTAIARYNEINPATGTSWTYCKEYLDYAYTIPLNYIWNVKNVPAYIGELGILPYNYENTPSGVNRGGAQYMEDLYDIVLHKHHLNTSFHPYDMSEFRPNMNANHEAAFRKAFGTN